MSYEIALYGVMFLGITPATYFCLTWSRSVSHFWTWAAFDAGGWVWAFLLLYIYSAATTALNYQKPHSAYQGLSSLVLGIGIDFVLWARTLRWYSVQRAFKKVANKYPSNSYDYPL